MRCYPGAAESHAAAGARDGRSGFWGRGEYRGVPPTGRRFTWGHVHFFRVVGGKLAEHWACRNDVGLLQQLGAFEPAEPRIVQWAS